MYFGALAAASKIDSTGELLRTFTATRRTALTSGSDTMSSDRRVHLTPGSWPAPDTAEGLFMKYSRPQKRRPARITKVKLVFSRRRQLRDTLCGSEPTDQAPAPLTCCRPPQLGRKRGLNKGRSGVSFCHVEKIMLQRTLGFRLFLLEVH
ncbi:hypothetical protein NDU88_004813 [Pleurodeles waltl]|uniref:Uncharacterized protein n=1 Tax=Pleurodeles waltl TaxID=8319 RepID=A0AAV7RKJ6_PLEWA|nr:hypothetical protein NDU88_004813 [Pleurodeles waltl]